MRSSLNEETHVMQAVGFFPLRTWTNLVPWRRNKLTNWGEEYLAGNFQSAWRYCHGCTDALHKKVIMDELIPDDRPVQLYLDIECKRGEYASPLTTDTSTASAYLPRMRRRSRARLGASICTGLVWTMMSPRILRSCS